MEKILHYRPPRIALVLLIVAWILHHFSPEKTILHLPLPLVGTICMVSGFWIMTWAWLHFRKAKTAVCPTAEATTLVTSGPYRLCRNPMYLGMLLVLAGAAFFMGSIVAVFAPFAFFAAMDNVFIPYEESSLDRSFGPEYAQYKKIVRKWI
jgi:protein-S-isoprenylcysteine O-methyltransferase Ste14